jgi:hypothetical protein
MALSGKDTGDSPPLHHSPQPRLDGGYPGCGQDVEGREVVNKIARSAKRRHLEIMDVGE